MRAGAQLRKFASVLRALQLIVVLALLYFLGNGAIQGLRDGSIRLRGGMTVTRHGQPLLFWLSIAACIVFSAVIITAYVLSFRHLIFSQ
jgi:hypothetical protein